jgi:hypothetical protein
MCKYFFSLNLVAALVIDMTVRVLNSEDFLGVDIDASDLNGY